MKKQILLMTAFALSFSVYVKAQIRELPKAVETTFTNQYKEATNVDYKDRLLDVDVSFDMNGEKMLATYSNKGVWKQTQQPTSYESFPAAIKDGFQKSKYADRETDEATILYLPGGITQYRVRAKKNDVEKKYLYFNNSGRLLRTSVTI